MWEDQLLWGWGMAWLRFPQEESDGIQNVEDGGTGDEKCMWTERMLRRTSRTWYIIGNIEVILGNPDFWDRKVWEIFLKGRNYLNCLLFPSVLGRFESPQKCFLTNGLFEFAKLGAMMKRWKDPNLAFKKGLWKNWPPHMSSINTTFWPFFWNLTLFLSLMHQAGWGWYFCIPWPSLILPLFPDSANILNPFVYSKCVCTHSQILLSLSSVNPHILPHLSPVIF